MFCSVFEHEKQVLAVFDFYCCREAYNLTEGENLPTQSVHFIFSLRIFLSDHLIIVSDMALDISLQTFFGSCVAICQLACSEISISINKNELGRSPGNGQTYYNLADGVTALAPLL